MFYVRAFCDSGCFGNWVSEKPTLKKLLQSFEIKPVGDFDRPSVFAADNRATELEAVAALRQKDRRIAKTFCLRITPDDLAVAGIAPDSSVRGQTGVRSVDERHCNLIGTRENFVRLVEVLLTRIWEAEDRLIVYADLTILGEVARLSKLKDGIDEHARVRCIDVLSTKKDFHEFTSQDEVTVMSKLDGLNPNMIRAVRRFVSAHEPRSAPWPVFLKRIVQWWNREK